MYKEIERKFLIDPVIFYNKILDEHKRNWNLLNTFFIEQTYYNDPNFRIRAKTSIQYGIYDIKYFFTIKNGQGIEREEVEVPIKKEIGEYLLNGKKKIQKHRYVTFEGWEVDHFFNPELNELWIAEKELKGINEKLLLPDWIIKEVTEYQEYNNYNLWKKIKQ